MLHLRKIDPGLSPAESPGERMPRLIDSKAARHPDRDSGLVVDVSIETGREPFRHSPCLAVLSSARE